QAKDHDEEPLFLKQDTHWSPRGVAVGAEVVAAHLRPLMGQYEPIHLTVRKQTIPGPNDMVLLLGLRPDRILFPQRQIELTQVFPTEDDVATTGDLAPIL